MSASPSPPGANGRAALPYPNPNPALWPRYGALGWLARLQLVWRERRYRQRGQATGDCRLTEVKPMAAAPGPRDIVLITVVRNAMATLPSFLDHYRRLGVQHFAVVDDASTDGSRAFLEAQPDLSLFTSAGNFLTSGGGLVWRDMLLDRIGRGRWVVSIDSDEYLIFPGCETRPLRSFVADLDRAGLKRAMAPMIDLYPEGPIGGVAPPADALSPPTALCPLFDGSHYEVADEKFCTSIRGGPRNRVFGTEMRMTKFPLLYADAALHFATNTAHGPLPLVRNFAPPDAVLLHQKFAPGAVEIFRTLAGEEAHFNGAEFYKAIVRSDGFGPHTDFRYEGSLRFQSSEDLVRRGFMRDLRN